MKYEFTEKEVRMFLAMRYSNEHNIRYVLNYAIPGIIALVIGVILTKFTTEWIGITSLLLIFSPAIYFTWRFNKASKAYVETELKKIQENI